MAAVLIFRAQGGDIVQGTYIKKEALPNMHSTSEYLDFSLTAKLVTYSTITIIPPVNTSPMMYACQMPVQTPIRRPIATDITTKKHLINKGLLKAQSKKNQHKIISPKMCILV